MHESNQDNNNLTSEASESENKIATDDNTRKKSNR